MLAVLVMMFAMLFLGEMRNTAYASGYPTRVEGVDPVLLRAYFMAEQRTEDIEPGCEGMTWTLVAAIGYVETRHATYSSSDSGNVDRTIAENGDVTPPIVGVALDGSGGNMAIEDTDGGELDGDDEWDRAVGPMQFIPGSWSGYGQDGNDDGEKNPQNVFDATAATVSHLCRSGGNDLTTESGLRNAIMGYNNSTEYYDKVMERKEHYDSIVISELAIDPDANCGGAPDRTGDVTLHPEMCELYVIMGTTFGNQGVWLGPMTPGGNMGEGQQNYHCVRPGDPMKHGSGNACDFYVGYPAQNASVKYPEAHQRARNLITTLIMNKDKYTNLCIIYEARIWWGHSDPVGAWMDVSSPMSTIHGDPTLDHFDHIHISVGQPSGKC
ncbi:lytic transglycosylase domain-containing protein [Nocardiopsis halotolerans]|uniref:lytic transglycosylase domain-containing protein n=1 Tax=Nocardiopsis halotolerans TaxID=124252 RepID=UPI00034567BB|nr:hypothetical protein [Nocardiopsis halotolerans]